MMVQGRVALPFAKQFSQSHQLSTEQAIELQFFPASRSPKLIAINSIQY
jgi:hypothetical protein